MDEERVITPRSLSQKGDEKQVTREEEEERRVGDQTSVAGSAGRRESARKNTGRNEREGAGAAGSSGVGSRG